MTELIKEKILDGIEDKYLSEAVDYATCYKVKKQRWISVLGRMAACFAIIIGLSVSSLSIAVAAGNMAAYDVLYAIYPACNNLHCKKSFCICKITPLFSGVIFKFLSSIIHRNWK